MITVMSAKSVVRTIKDAGFTSTTSHIVHVDGSRPRANSCVGTTSITVPKASADNVSVVQVPVVIAHSPPGSVVEHLNPPFQIVTTTDQSYVLHRIIS